MTEPPEEPNEFLVHLGWMSPLKYFLKIVYTQVPSKESHSNVGEELGILAPKVLITP
jgi:hypothetical protein